MISALLFPPQSRRRRAAAKRVALCITAAVIGTVVLARTPAARAQHDPQRNAMRLVSAERLDAAEKELRKANAEDPESLFVRCVIALRRGDRDAALRMAQQAVQRGLPFDRLLAGPLEYLAPLHESPAFRNWMERQRPSPLLHGPLVGAVTDSSAAIWVRTREPANVRVVARTEDGAVAVEARTTTTWKTDRTAVVRLERLPPAAAIHYRVLVGEADVPAAEGRFRTFPETGRPARFVVGFGGGAGYVPERERMWDTIRASNPLAFLMLGDNVYIDDPEHPATQRYCYYRRQSRPEWRRFTAQTAIFAIYDDHDFGTNDCVPGPHVDRPPWKRRVWTVFRQNWANPAYGGGERQPGCWFDFHIADVHFILLDGRYYRSRDGEPSMLGPVQKQWLFETLRHSPARFKVIASPVPFTPGVKPGSKDTWDGFAAEREELFRLIERERIEGVFLIAADRHRTDLRVIERPDGYDLFEFESSKLTNRHTHPIVRTPGLIWGYNRTCSWARMTFDTTAKDPTVRFDVVTIDGDVPHSYTLPLSKLRFAGR
ncbi:MAG: alkaline phosphatase [Planctomycetota bacterium]|nr:MAG: alkaline phosphatase [Planctomycetota bacterium]